MREWLLFIPELSLVTLFVEVIYSMRDGVGSLRSDKESRGALTRKDFSLRGSSENRVSEAGQVH